jgi:hypothetical protein
MGRVSLEDALELLLLYAAVDDGKYEKAAARWLGRLTLERDATLAEIQLAAGSLQAAHDRPEAAVAALRLVAQPRGETGTLAIVEALGLVRTPTR